MFVDMLIVDIFTRYRCAITEDGGCYEVLWWYEPMHGLASSYYMLSSHDDGAGNAAAYYVHSTGRPWVQ